MKISLIIAIYGLVIGLLNVLKLFYNPKKIDGVINSISPFIKHISSQFYNIKAGCLYLFIFNGSVIIISIGLIIYLIVKSVLLLFTSYSNIMLFSGIMNILLILLIWYMFRFIIKKLNYIFKTYKYQIKIFFSPLFKIFLLLVLYFIPLFIVYKLMGFVWMLLLFSLFNIVENNSVLFDLFIFNTLIFKYILIIVNFIINLSLKYISEINIIIGFLIAIYSFFLEFTD